MIRQNKFVAKLFYTNTYNPKFIHTSRTIRQLKIVFDVISLPPPASKAIAENVMDDI